MGGVTTQHQLLVRSFLGECKQRTARAYEGDLRQFCAFVGAANLEETAQALLCSSQEESTALVHGFRAAMIERGLSCATVNRRLATLRSLIRKAHAAHLIPWTLDVANVASSAAPRRGGKYNRRAIFNLLMVLLESRGDPKSLRDRAAVRLLFDLSLRRDEVVSLDVEHVDLEALTLAVQRKREPDREILPLSTPTSLALGMWLEARGRESGPLFVNFDRAGKGRRLTGRSLYRIVTGLGQELGVRITPHGLRARAPPTPRRRVVAI